MATRFRFRLYASSVTVMANEHYDALCRATITGLTGLDRQILAHYCTRFNEHVQPPRAWPGEAEIVRLTGVNPDSVRRAKRRLTKLTFLIHITKGKPGTQSEYAPNMPLIESYIQVTDGSPIKKNKVTVETALGDCRNRIR